MAPNFIIKGVCAPSELYSAGFTKYKDLTPLATPKTNNPKGLNTKFEYKERMQFNGTGMICIQSIKPLEDNVALEINPAAIGIPYRTL